MGLTLTIFDSASGLTPEALLSLSAFDRNHFPTPWSARDWSELFSGAERFILMAREGQELRGFSLFELSDADSFAHLLKIVVDPNQRQKGIGKKLLEESLKELKALGVKTFFLEVEEENHSAIGLYEKMGFRVIHRKKHFYSNGANALIMTLGEEAG